MQIGTLWQALAKLGTPRRLNRGEIIFIEGDRATSVYLLEAGRVRLYVGDEDGRELILSIVRPGEVFGEVAPAAGTRREASAEVISRQALMREIRWGLILAQPNAAALTQLFLGEIARRCAERNRRLLDQAYLPVEGLVRRVLADLVARDGHVLDLTHYDLAHMCGCAREGVTRALNGLARRGILLLASKSITVLRPDLLGAGAAEGA